MRLYDSLERTLGTVPDSYDRPEDDVERVAFGDTVTAEIYYRLSDAEADVHLRSSVQGGMQKTAMRMRRLHTAYQTLEQLGNDSFRLKERDTYDNKSLTLEPISVETPDTLDTIVEDTRAALRAGGEDV